GAPRQERKRTGFIIVVSQPMHLPSGELADDDGVALSRGPRVVIEHLRGEQLAIAAEAQVNQSLSADLDRAKQPPTGKVPDMKLRPVSREELLAIGMQEAAPARPETQGPQPRDRSIRESVPIPINARPSRLSTGEQGREKKEKTNRQNSGTCEHGLSPWPGRFQVEEKMTGYPASTSRASPTDTARESQHGIDHASGVLRHAGQESPLAPLLGCQQFGMGEILLLHFPQAGHHLGIVKEQAHLGIEGK